MTNPSEIGISFTPFPFSLLRTNYSRISADSLPKCLKCGAFINKYDICEGYTFKCPLCGHSTVSRIAFELDGAEFTDDVYEAYCTKYPINREQFTPTDFFLISLSLLKTCPNLLDIIDDAYSLCSQPKQIGIAFIHGGITVVKFRENLSFQTYPNEIPIIRLPTIFILSDQFRKSLPLIKSKAKELVSIEEFEGESGTKVPNFIKFIVQCCTRFGTSGKLFLDEKDFHSAAMCKDIRNEALYSCRFGSQISIFPIFNRSSNFSNVSYKSPLFDFCSITGGFLKFFNIDNTSQEAFISSISNFRKSILPILKHSLFHDTVLYIVPPIDCQVTDFAGNGFLKSHFVISIPKIKIGDTFFFKIDAKSITHPFLQFVVFFTNEVGVKKIRIYTAKIEDFPTEDLYAMSSFLAAITAQRLLVEDETDLKKFIDSLKKKYATFQERFPVCSKAEALLLSCDYGETIEKALECRQMLSLKTPINISEVQNNANEECEL